MPIKFCQKINKCKEQLKDGRFVTLQESDQLTSTDTQLRGCAIERIQKFITVREAQNSSQ